MQDTRVRTAKTGSRPQQTRSTRRPRRGGLMVACASAIWMLGGCGAGAGAGAGPDATTPSTAGSAAAAGRSPAVDAAPAQVQSSGPKAPDFSLRALSGGSVRLSSYRGKKVVLLDFWSTSCHPCLQEMPELVAIYHEYKDRGFEILAISTDDPDTRAQVSAEVRSKKMDFPVLLDDETTVLDRYNPKGELPFAVLIDRGGSIVLKRASYQAGDEESIRSLRAAIESALASP